MLCKNKLTELPKIQYLYHPQLQWTSQDNAFQPDLTAVSEAAKKNLSLCTVLEVLTIEEKYNWK